MTWPTKYVLHLGWEKKKKKKDDVSPKEEVIKNFEIYEIKMLDNFIVLTTLLV